MKDKLLQAFGSLVDSAIAASPKISLGIVLVLIGLVVAKGIEILLRFLLTRVRFDRLVERAGLDRTLYRLGIRQQLNSFLPKLVYFLVLFILAKTVADALAITAVSNALAAFFAYLPNIVAALLLMILGSSLGQFAGETVTQAAEAADIDFAASLGKVVSGLIIFVVSMMAIGQLKIDTEIVRTVISFLLGGLALAFGVSFGLGTRETISNIAAGHYLRKVVAVGRQTEVAGEKGLLVAITPTHAILQTGAENVTISNVNFFNSTARQEARSTQ